MNDRRPDSDVGKHAWPRAPHVLLRIPLLYKILIANGLIVAVGASGGTTLVHHLTRTRPEISPWLLVLTLGSVGCAASVLVNWLILTVALAPLRGIERTARRIDAGDLDARAPAPMTADRDLLRLARVLNQMLDRLSRYRSRLRELTADAVAAAENERKRLSRELHDDTAQRLAALLLRLRSMRRKADDAGLCQDLDDLRAELSETLESVRRYARGLRPPALDDAGFEAAVRGLGLQTAAAGMDVDVRVQGRIPPLDDEVEIALYRMLQEALSNALRHSGADEATVTIASSASRVRIAVIDRGRGFDPEQELRSGAGLGLFGLQERATQIGGKVRIESRPDVGTTVRIDLPLGESGPDGNELDG